jgi:hypothetical protein
MAHGEEIYHEPAPVSWNVRSGEVRMDRARPESYHSAGVLSCMSECCELKNGRGPSLPLLGKLRAALVRL